MLGRLVGDVQWTSDSGLTRAERTRGVAHWSEQRRVWCDDCAGVGVVTLPECSGYSCYCLQGESESADEFENRVQEADNEVEEAIQHCKHLQ